MKDLNYICVVGYGWSGSSACIDILKEFEGFTDVGGEFRIAKDPYGLLDLENSLVHNWDFIRNDIAIVDFIKYCEMLSRSTGLFKKSGKSFSDKLNIDFMRLVHDYIDSVISMTYYGDSSVHRYYLSSVKLFLLKVRSKFGKENAIKTYYSRISEDEFVLKTQIFLDSVFNNFINNNGTVILDQPISPVNINNTIKYFKLSKVIVIDRDPRDIYSNLVKNKVLIGADLKNYDSVEKYVKWHNAMRTGYNEKADSLFCSQILRLNFEDLVCNYEHSVSKIIDFLGGDVVHDKKRKYFNPDSDRAKSNVGLWRKYPDQSVMDEIKYKLDKYYVEA